MKRRILSALLIVSLLLSLLPGTALAAEGEAPWPESGTEATEEAGNGAEEETEAQGTAEDGGIMTVAASNEVKYPVTGGYIYFDKATGTITDCDESVAVADIPSVIGRLRDAII